MSIMIKIIDWSLITLWVQTADGEVLKKSKNVPSPKRRTAFEPRGAEIIVALATDSSRASPPEFEVSRTAPPRSIA